VSAIPPGIECVVSDSSVVVSDSSVVVSDSGVVVSDSSVVECLVTTDPCASIIDCDGMTLDEFIVHVRNKTRNGLFDEYSEIKSQPPDGTFDTARMMENLAKNRYTDVLCYDHTRVILTRDDNDLDTDYINANFVDGYKQRNAFISSQGPLPRTFPDFWQMVWEQRTLLVVMTTRAVERHRTKCGQYWPELEGTSITCGIYEIHSENIENYEDFIITSLTITNTRSEEVRSVSHFQFTSWPDYGTPDSALSMLQFLQCVREKQNEMLLQLEDSWNGHPLGPPIIVHCSAGIGRTGTFCTLDIAIRKFEDIGKVDIRSTVDCIRAQRAFSIQMPDQYVFCHLAFLEYVLNMGYVEEIDLTGFDESQESE
jgi:tyrosine-protein phosphatase non-receptor type 9